LNREEMMDRVIRQVSDYFGEPVVEAERINCHHNFTELNREEMMDRVIRQVSDYFGEPVVEAERINCHHNFTEQEEHFGKSVWLSRKGAISARAGQPGLIPGSMGTASYVVAGRGNPVA
ncbi:RtcB family protein, partial [Paenibacillus sp. TAF58]